MNTERELTAAQERSLDRVDKRDPEARVTGWINDPAFGRGPIVTLSDGSERLINVNGYLRKV